MPETIRVALVNDYEIVVKGLRALLHPYEPEISVVELDVKRKPQRPVDITLFDTYGEEKETLERTQELASDSTNGAIIVFSFTDEAAVAHNFVRAGAQGFISKATPAAQIVDGIKAAARGQRVMVIERSERGTMPP